MINVRLSNRKRKPKVSADSVVNSVFKKITFYRTLMRTPRYCILSEKSLIRANHEALLQMNKYRTQQALPSSKLEEIHGLKVVVLPNTEDEIIELGF